MDAVVLTVVTLNVLQIGQQAEARYEHIDKGLRALDADIITLQEVRKLGPRRTSADVLLPEYTHRAVDGRYRGYYLAILRKPPIKRTVGVPFPNTRARMAFGAVLDVRGVEVLVLTTHLDYQLKHNRQRRRQLQLIFEQAAGFKGPVILTGDMNFGDAAPENALISGSYVDVWRRLHPTDPGMTWDNEKNPMALRGRLKGEPSRRLDRVIVRALEPISARLVFTKPIRGRLFPSDHFGVLARLRL